MNKKECYEEIKKISINNEVYKRVKNFSINKHHLETYYNVGKSLAEASKVYGEEIIKKYSNNLTNELGIKFSSNKLLKIRKFYYLLQEGMVLSYNLSWSQYSILLELKDVEEINYYINKCIIMHLSIKQLKELIKIKEYKN